MDPRSPPQALIHFYRASVQHADVWRQRLDATTNWAVVTTAAVLTFAFGNRQTEHFVVLVALVFDFFFLFMESRRYQTYNLWQRRIRVLHRFFIAPALAEASEQWGDPREAKLAELAADLGKTVPAITVPAALGYRIRRNYGPLVTLVILTWTLKVYVHPEPVHTLADYVDRARVGLVPGAAVLVAVGLFLAVFVYLAIRAPSEQMEGWVELPAPIDRIMPSGIKLPGAQKRAGMETGLRPEDKAAVRRADDGVGEGVDGVGEDDGDGEGDAEEPPPEP